VTGIPTAIGTRATCVAAMYFGRCWETTALCRVPVIYARPLRHFRHPSPVDACWRGRLLGHYRKRLPRVDRLRWRQSQRNCDRGARSILNVGLSHGWLILSSSGWVDSGLGRANG
jgi:hypothetical protein